MVSKSIALVTSSVLAFFAITTSAKVFDSGEEAGHKFLVEEIAEDFSTIWGMEFIDSQTLMLAEKRGRIFLLDVNSGNRTQVEGAPQVLNSGQGGLLDIASTAQAPGWLYFTYVRQQNQSSGNGVTVLARAKLDNKELKQWQELLVTESATFTSRHFGSRIAFDNSGHVFFTVGDRGERETSQDLSNHAGTVIRLNLDGSIPNDNPFIKQKGAQPEIWSYGHRNPQGLSYDSVTGRLWTIEHGPRGGDEINLVNPGKNYGWPVISYGKEYFSDQKVGESTHKAGMEQPVKYYVPSIAPGSLVIYQGDAFPKWQGSLMAGALKLTHINMVELNAKGEATSEVRLLENQRERIRDIEIANNGWIYYTTDSGKVRVLKPDQ